MRAHLSNLFAVVAGCLLLCAGPILAGLGWIGG